MHADDQSFADLMELCGEHFGKRPRTDTTGPFDRPHGRHRSNKSSSSSDSTGDLLARLCLRQEVMYAQLMVGKARLANIHIICVCVDFIGFSIEI